MLLTTPYGPGIDESPHRNQLRQIAVPIQAVEGTLVTFTRDRVTGWLFQPTVGIWGAPEVFRQTQTLAEAAGLRITTVSSWYDVDSPSDLDRVARADTSRAVRTKPLIGVNRGSPDQADT